MPFPHICSLGFGKPLFFLRFILTVLFEKESSILVFFFSLFYQKNKDRNTKNKFGFG
jgi:hypothetical protein